MAFILGGPPLTNISFFRFQMNLPGSCREELKELVQSSGIPVIALGTNADEYVLAQASLYRIIAQVHTKNIECKYDVPFHTQYLSDKLAQDRL